MAEATAIGRPPHRAPTRWQKYPEPGTPAAEAVVSEAFQWGCNFRVIPPALRQIVPHCHSGCRTCSRWTRNGGGCPGLAAGSRRQASDLRNGNNGARGELDAEPRRTEDCGLEAAVPACHSTIRVAWDEAKAIREAQEVDA